MYPGHVVEVVVGDDNILGVAGHVYNLERAKGVFGRYKVMPPPHLPRWGEIGVTCHVTLQSFSQKEVWRSWTGRWVFTSHRDGVLSSCSTPAAQGT